MNRAPHRATPNGESFEKFYYTKVGLGEGCGCAERIIDVRDLDRLANRAPMGGRKPASWLKRLIDRFRPQR